MFNPGQKVVCIRSEGSNLVEKEIYTVFYMWNLVSGVTLEEIDPWKPYDCYDMNRFRPIDDDWIAELLDRVLSEVESEELLEV